MASSTQVFFTRSSSAGVSYSTTTLTASLTTAFTTESVYTTYGQEETSTFLVATVIGPGTEVINETSTSTSTPNKTLIIVGASLGGFVALVIIGLIFFFVTRQRRRRRPHMITNAAPSLGYASPNIPPASLTPFAYQPAEHSQPHEPLLMDDAPNVGMYPPSVTSEKRKPNLLQRSPGHQRGPSEATITTTSAGSIPSQPQTTTSGISPSPPPTGFYQPVHKSQPLQSHQRSPSAGSGAPSFQSGPDRQTSVGSTGPPPSASRVPVSTPPYFGPPGGHTGAPTAPMIHEETPPVTPMQNQGFQQYGQYQPYQPQGQSHSFHPNQPPPAQNYYHQGQDQGYTSAPSNAPAVGSSYSHHPQHQTSFHAQNAPAGPGSVYSAGGASSSSGAAGSRDQGNVIGATVDRGDGGAAQVFTAKNNIRNEPRPREDSMNDSATNLTELPPAYASLRPRNP